VQNPQLNGPLIITCHLAFIAISLEIDKHHFRDVKRTQKMTNDPGVTARKWMHRYAGYYCDNAIMKCMLSLIVVMTVVAVVNVTGEVLSV
jgi:ABC-type lipoprotein release transport system permease subunit